MNPGELLSQFITLEHIPFPKKHEDSYFFDFSDEEFHLLAVFDGCGGLGARRYSLLDNQTGASLAAQTCSAVAAHWKNKITAQQMTNAALLADLFQKEALDKLQGLEEKYADNNKLIGTMVRTLPCTASMALVLPNSKAEGVTLTAINAGDSRVYVLTSEQGLQQLTRDDLRGNPDALMNLYVGAPLTNVINIDVPFELRTSTVKMSQPFAVLAATDGVFGYVRTPIDFEYMLLNRLCESASMEEFEKAFQADVASIAGDDATAVMAFYGWSSFKAIKKDFQQRAALLAELCECLDRDPSDDNIESVWNKYKTGAYL